MLRIYIITSSDLEALITIRQRSRVLGIYYTKIITINVAVSSRSRALRRVLGPRGASREGLVALRVQQGSGSLGYQS